MLSEFYGKMQGKSCAVSPAIVNGEEGYLTTEVVSARPPILGAHGDASGHPEVIFQRRHKSTNQAWTRPK